MRFFIVVFLFYNFQIGICQIKTEDFQLKNISIENVEYAAIIFDPLQKKYLICNDSLAKRKFSPASTFKIANAIIGLETNVLSDEKQVFEWDGKKRANDKWNQSQDLETAFKNSTVWYFQALARKIGEKRMSKMLRKLNYVDKDFKINNDIDSFWLNGNLKKNLFEQVDFVQKLAFEDLATSKKTYKTIEKIMFSHTIEDVNIYAKTGWAVDCKLDIGWYIGYAVKSGIKYPFGTILVTNDYKSFDFQNLRKEIAFEALRSIGVIH